MDTKEIKWDYNTVIGIPHRAFVDGVSTRWVYYTDMLSFYLYIKYNRFRNALYPNRTSSIAEIADTLFIEQINV